MLPMEQYHAFSSPFGSGGVGFVMAAAAPAIAASGPAAPFVAAAMIVAPFMIKLLANSLKGCGQSCVLTSEAANEVEELLKRNLEMYMESGRTKAEQRAAVDYFDLVWAQLVEFCGQPEFQTTRAGRNCVEDRKEGACKWKEGGTCWNWFVGYRDPIANDDAARPDAAGSSGGGIDVATLFDGKDSSMLLVFAAAVALVYVSS